MIIGNHTTVEGTSVSLLCLAAIGVCVFGAPASVGSLFVFRRKT